MGKSPPRQLCGAVVGNVRKEPKMKVEEYLKTNHYLKSKEIILNDLNTALSNLKSDDPKIRKKGEKRLSSNARRELGWNCITVREWFLDDSNKTKIYKVIQDEKADKLLAGYLLTLSFFYERYIDHDMWDEIYEKQVEVTYKKWIKSITDLYSDYKSSLVKKEIAYLLAIIGDNKAWDIFNELIKRKNSISGWVFFACSRYAEKSINQKQLKELIITFDSIIKKTNNPKVKREVNKAKDACLKIEKNK
ncbi:MAG: hypothetical protein ACPGVB_10175 [Chitinophagales bacterium]